MHGRSAEASRLVAAIERRDRERIAGAPAAPCVAQDIPRRAGCTRHIARGVARRSGPRASRGASARWPGRTRSWPTSTAGATSTRSWPANCRWRSNVCRRRCASRPRVRSPPFEPLPLRPFRGELDWPAAGTVRARFGVRQRDGRTASKSAADDGTPVVRHSRGHGRVCRDVRRLRQPRHPRPRWHRRSACTATCSRSRSRRAPRRSAGSPSAPPGNALSGAARPLFRAAHRRTSGRSFTMARSVAEPL